MMPKNLISLLRLLVLLLGFATICLGAFCISTGASACKCNNFPVAYLLLPTGFILLISGIFWCTCHEASKHKGLFHSFLQESARLRNSHINTIDRYVSCVSPLASVHFFPALFRCAYRHLFLCFDSKNNIYPGVLLSAPLSQFPFDYWMLHISWNAPDHP